MSGIKHHYPIIRQHQKRRVIMVIRLEPRTYQYLHLLTSHKIVLHSFDITVYVDVTNIRFANIFLTIFMMDGSRIRKPTPGPFGR